MSRIAANIFLFVAVLYFPWWLLAIFGVGFLFTFRSFYEIIFWAFVADMLYGTSVEALYGIQTLLTFGAIILFVLVQMLKKHIRFYDER